MIAKKTYPIIVLVLIGIPILFQTSGVTELRNAVSVMAERPGPNLVLQKNGVQKSIPKYSTIKLADGREGLYLWVYQDEVHLELEDGGGRAVVSPDQIRLVVLHNVNIPVATIGFGILVGTVSLGATRKSETFFHNRTVTYFDEELQEEVTEIHLGGYKQIITYYPENALAFGAIGAIGGGFIARALKKRSTFDIGANGWEIRIIDTLVK